jgi:hypothetical protein
MIILGLVGAFDATKFSADFDRIHCVSFIGLKDNYCNKETNITLIFPSDKYRVGGGCGEVSINLKVGETSCTRVYISNDKFVNDSTVSCTVNLKDLFDKSCRPSYLNDIFARTGDGLDKEWKIEFFTANNLGNVRLGELNIRVISEEDRDSIKKGLQWECGAIILSLVTFIFSFIERKKNKKLAILSLIVGIASLVVAIVLLRY